MNLGISVRQPTIPLVIRSNRQVLGKSRIFQVVHGLIGVRAFLIVSSARLKTPSYIDQESNEGQLRFDRFIAPDHGRAGGEQIAEVLRISPNDRQATFIFDRLSSTIQAKQTEVYP
jgi:hypothetical protein